MGSNVAVAVTADVGGAVANLAVLKTSLKDATKAMNDMAKTATPGDKISPELFKASETVGMLTAQARIAERELAGKMVPALAATAHGSAGVTRELMVMIREAARGNWGRMAGSFTILAGRMGLMTTAVLAGGGAALAVAAPFIALAAAAEQGATELGKFQGAMQATNGYAGITISQLQEMSAKLAAFAHESIGTATEQMMKLAASGKFTGQTMLLVGEDSARMAGLTGESAEKFQEFFGKMGDGVAKFTLEYQEKYGQLTTAQYEYIRQLEEQGNKEGAEMALAKDVYDYLGTQAPQQLGYLERAWHSLRDTVSGTWDTMKAVGRDSNKDQLAAIDEQIAALKNNGGRAHNGGSEEVYSRGIDLHKTELQILQQKRAEIVATEAAQERAAATQAATTNTQKEGVKAAAQLAEKFEASKTSGEKLRETIKGINADLAAAVKADPGGKAKYEAEAAAARAQAEKSDSPHAAKAPKGPGDVSEWTEQLHAQEIASGEFFKDQTAAELAFWQSKLGLVKSGSKGWLEVQGHIFEASKALAHQAYEEQIAVDNDKIAADKDNWSKEKADWDAKLAYIKTTFGDQSTEYRNAYRELETLEREHNDAMQRAQQEGRAKAVESLKKQLDDARKAREDDARAQETLIKAKGNASPFGGVAAAQQEGAIKSQLIDQEIADLARLRTAKDAELQQSIDNAQQDATKYAAQQAAKKNADAEFDAEHTALLAKQRQQSIETDLAMQQAYHSYIDSTVSATVTGLDGIASKNKSWQQLEIGIYGSLVRTAEQQLEKMAENWIIKHLLMTAAHTTAAAQQTAASATAAGAQTAATTAASKAQVVMLAGLAGAGGVASMAAAPWPLDMTAPAFGASMAATATSLGSFAQGTDLVPNDMIAQIHAGERIIPKADNQALMSAVAGGASNDNRRGGDMHMTYAPTIHGQMPFADQLAQHETNIIGMMKRAHRNGVFR